MTYTPDTLAALRAYLQPITHLDPNALGIQHWSPDGGGYHEGWDLLAEGVGRDDYSVCESARDAHPTDAASAIDVGDFAVDAFSRHVTLRDLTLWLVGQCQAGAMDTLDIREIIYTPDGQTVRRWDRQGVRSSGDDSHLFHTHISYFRDSEARDKVGLFRRFFEGDDMAWTAGEAKVIQRIDERVGTIIGDLDHAPSLGDANGVRRRLAAIQDALTALSARPPGTFTDAQIHTLGDQLAAAAVARHDALTDADKPTIAAALRDVLRTGVGTG